MPADARDGDGARIGSRVRAARGRLGWTRETLAVHSGLSWSAITQVESGRRTNVRPSTVAALSRALGVSIDYLVCGTPSASTMLVHSAFPYRSDGQFVTTVGTALMEGIERSEALLAVTTAANVELLREYLGKDARRVEFIEARSFYTTPVATLAAYRAYIDAKLKRDAHWVRIVGEPVWIGRSDSEARLWTCYESLLNLVFSAYPLTILCPYDERLCPAEIVRQAHLTHPHMIGEEGARVSTDCGDPGMFAFEN